MATTLVLLSTSCVNASKNEAIEKQFAANDNINVVNTTKILLNEEQQKSLPIENASQFCNGSIVAFLLQSSAEIDFDGIQKTNKIGKNDIYRTNDPFFITKLKQFLFPQKASMERTLILCHPPLNNENLDKIKDELKLLGIFILFSDEISSKDKPCIASFFNKTSNENEEKQDTETDTNISCTAILCESFGCIDAIRLKIGCADKALLESHAPNSWRLAFRDNDYSFVQTSKSAIVPELTSQRTLALIKPTAVGKGFTDTIIADIKANGFTIISQKRVHLKLEHAQYFYSEHQGKPFYDNLTDFMSSGPIYALVLERVAAIRCWRTMLGPTNTLKAKETAPQSIRARFGTDQTANACHGSDSVESAQREIKFYFPEIGPASNEIQKSENVVENYMLQKLGNNESLKDFLIRGLAELAKQKPESKLKAVEWFGHWLLDHNPQKPQVEEPEDAAFDGLNFVARCKRINGGFDLQIIFVLGGPGSGKGTQCERIVKQYGFTQISTGDLCRNVMNDPASIHQAEIKEIMANGKLVPTELLLQLLKDEMLRMKDYKYLLDGFPRSLEQCIMFEKEVKGCSFALNFVCSDDILTERCLKRAESSGRIDDNKESIVKRLQTFHEVTDPTVEYLKSMDVNKVKDVDAEKDMDSVWSDVQIAMQAGCGL